MGWNLLKTLVVIPTARIFLNSSRRSRSKHIDSVLLMLNFLSWCCFSSESIILLGLLKPNVTSQILSRQGRFLSRKAKNLSALELFFNYFNVKVANIELVCSTSYHKVIHFQTMWKVDIKMKEFHPSSYALLMVLYDRKC